MTRQGDIDAVVVVGEFDLSNLEGLEKAIETVLSRGNAASCLLDLSEATFIDSSVVHALVRWSKETQVSEREGLAILVGARESPVARLLALVGLIDRLPVFTSVDGATAALQNGKKPRTERPLRWLTDLELVEEREQAQAGSDAATRRLDAAVAEEEARQKDPDD